MSQCGAVSSTLCVGCLAQFQVQVFQAASSLSAFSFSMISFFSPSRVPLASPRFSFSAGGRNFRFFHILPSPVLGAAVGQQSPPGQLLSGTGDQMLQAMLVEFCQSGAGGPSTCPHAVGGHPRVVEVRSNL